ncbi:MAG: hypothetical protein WC455_20385 [Dehalococcoidia bacterium]|jgi:hypothetical protein
MILTDEQHDRIKEIVILAVWSSRYRWKLDPDKQTELKAYMKSAFLNDPEFYAHVNTTVQHIIEVLDSPVRHDPTPPDPPGTGAQENLTQGWK